MQKAPVALVIYLEKGLMLKDFLLAFLIWQGDSGEEGLRGARGPKGPKVWIYNQ